MRFRLPQELGNIPLHISFPEGATIGVAKPRVRVEATFSSNKPVSFTANVEFIDAEDKVYIIKIAGTTDNCLLTNY